MLHFYSGVYTKADQLSGPTPLRKRRLDKGIQFLYVVTKDKGLIYPGSYDGQGWLSDKLKPILKPSQGVTDEEWEKRMAGVDQHPNDEGLQRAKDLAKDILAKF